MHPLVAAVGAAGAKPRIPFERKIDIRGPVEAHVAIELIRRDARHDMRGIIQRERRADDVRIGGEMILPVPVSQDHGRLAGRAEARSARQPHADRLEIVRGDEHRPHGLFL